MAHPFIHVVNFEENAIHAETEGAGVLPTQQLPGIKEVALVTSPDPVSYTHLTLPTTGDV